MIVPPRLINMLQIGDIALGRWPTVAFDPEIIFITATAWVSWEFLGSLLHSSSSPSIGSLHIDLYSWYSLITDSTEKRQTPSLGPSDIIAATGMWTHANYVYSSWAQLYIQKCFYVRLIKYSSWNRQSLFRQWCFPCHFAKVCTLQSFPTYGNLVSSWWTTADGAEYRCSSFSHEWTDLQNSMEWRESSSHTAN